MLDELQTAVATVTERIGAATVTIGRDRRGTGVVVADGQVLTNAHNLRDRTTQVTFADGRTAQAEVLGADPDGDLAVLAVDTTGAAAAEWSANARGRARSCSPRPVVVTVCGSRSASSAASTVSSAAPAAAGSPAASSTPRRSPEDPPEDRSSTPRDACVGLNTHRLGDGFYLAIPADSGLRERIDRTRRRPLTDAPPPRHRRRAVVRRPPSAPCRGPPRARRPARARRRRRLAGRGRRRHDGRPHRLRQRVDVRRRRRPVGGPRRARSRTRRRRSTSGSSGAPRS